MSEQINIPEVTGDMGQKLEDAVTLISHYCFTFQNCKGCRFIRNRGCILAATPETWSATTE